MTTLYTKDKADWAFLLATHIKETKLPKPEKVSTVIFAISCPFLESPDQ